MLDFINGSNVWSDVGPVFRSARGVRRAAIAFASSAALELLALRAGDRVVVNAGTRALRAGATDPAVLRQWHEAGAEVYVHQSLHAKVFAAGARAGVGSANASAAAQGASNEAVLITDDRAVVAAVRAYIDTLAEES